MKFFTILINVDLFLEVKETTLLITFPNKFKYVRINIFLWTH